MNCLICKSTETNLIFTKKEHEQYYLCKLCSAYFLAPEFHPTHDLEFNHYEKHDNNPEDEGYQNYVRPLFDEIRAKLPEGLEGLDFGAGPGPVLSVMLEEQGHKMVQWDPYYAKNDECLKKQYDFIICSEVAEHFHEPLKSWELMSSLLKPNGILGVMTCFAPETDLFPGWHYHRDPTHVCFYTPKTMQWLQAKLGFQRLEITEPRVSLFFKSL